jgi:aryl-alcohol dehydrogenase-like predicted oxidoreductase
MYLDDAVAMMRTLRDEGKICAVGLSAYSNEDFLRLVPKIEPDALQSFAHAMDDHFVREGEPVHNLMKERGLSFVAFSPLGQGLLLGKFSAKSPPQFAEGDNRSRGEKFKADNLAKLEPKIAKIKERFGSDIRDLARVSIQYLLASDVVACAIPGFRNLKQVEIDVAAGEKPLTAEEVSFVREVFAN